MKKLSVLTRVLLIILLPIVILLCSCSIIERKDDPEISAKIILNDHLAGADRQDVMALALDNSDSLHAITGRGVYVFSRTTDSLISGGSRYSGMNLFNRIKIDKLGNRWFINSMVHVNIMHKDGSNIDIGEDKFSSGGIYTRGPASLEVDDSGNAIVAFMKRIYDNSGKYVHSIVTAKVDANGSILWHSEIAIPFHEKRDLLPTSVAVDSNGYYVLSRFNANPPWDTDGALIIKYDFQGNIGWQRQLICYINNSIDSCAPNHILADGKGHLFVTGWWGKEAFLAKFNSTGSLLWHNVLDSNSNYSNFWSDNGLWVDESGNAYMIAGVRIWAYNEDGDLLWKRIESYSSLIYKSKYESDRYVDAEAIMGYGNAFYIVGNVDMYTKDSRKDQTNLVVIKHDLSGKQLWTFRYSGEDKNAQYGYSILDQKYNNLYVGGSSGDKSLILKLELGKY